MYVEGQLQTRKYTDKDGAERTTTEVVLQRYRGELTLMDSRAGGADEGGGYDRVSGAGGGGGGGSFGRSSPMDQRPAGGRWRRPHQRCHRRRHPVLGARWPLARMTSIKKSANGSTNDPRAD